MEGLDLFTPVVTPDSSSESSDSDWLGSEGGSDSDYEAYASGKRSEKTSKGLKVYISTRGATERSGSPVVDVEGDVSEKDFEIEKVWQSWYSVPPSSDTVATEGAIVSLLPQSWQLQRGP